MSKATRSLSRVTGSVVEEYLGLSPDRMAAFLSSKTHVEYLSRAERKEFLVRLYWKEYKSQREIAEEINRSAGWVSTKMDEYEIPVRPTNASEETHEQLREVVLARFESDNAEEFGWDDPASD